MEEGSSAITNACKFGYPGLMRMRLTWLSRQPLLNLV